MGVELFEIFPELTSLNGLSRLRGSEMELLRDSTSQIYKSFSHLSTIQRLVGSVQLSVGLLHERHPEFVVVCAMTIQRGLALRVVRNSSVNNYILPATILEELEDGKTILDTVIDNKVLEEFWVGALHKERSKEPAVT